MAIWSPLWVCIIHGSMSGIVYQRVNKSTILRPNDYTIDGNHIYKNSETTGETVDAIIKWDYKPPEITNIFKKQKTSWVII